MLLLQIKGILFFVYLFVLFLHIPLFSLKGKNPLYYSKTFLLVRNVLLMIEENVRST